MSRSLGGADQAKAVDGEASHNHIGDSLLIEFASEEDQVGVLECGMPQAQLGGPVGSS
jgi:hypothetical protein